MLRLALGCAQRWFVRRLRWEVIRVNKIKNLFPKIFDFENLFDAYKAGIRGKRAGRILWFIRKIWKET